MNNFGTIFRLSIFGESHGAAVGVTIDGCPAGISLIAADFIPDIDRRRGGTQPGTTPRKEEDLPVFLSGVFNNKTTGAPLTVIFENKDVRSADYEKQRDIPRPGHADFTAHEKFSGFEDYRGSGHFSGRLTLALVAAGIIAKKLLCASLPEFRIRADVTEIGGNRNIANGLAAAVEKNDSVGGLVECRVGGLPVGFGEPFFNSAESLIAHLMFAVPAVKGVEFGSGFSAANMYGAEHNDPIVNSKGETASNYAGGISGGLTNGNELIFRAAIKPASSTPQEQKSLNTATGNAETFTVTGRHDLAIVLRVPVIAEAVAAIVLADLFLLRKTQL